MKKIVVDKSFTKTEEYRRKQSEIAKRSWAARKAKAQQIQNS